MHAIGKLFIFFLILFFGLAGLAFYWTFYKPLPDYEATLKLPLLNQPVDIHWDKDGIPHIYAANKKDLYFALGYVHAQDRLWQMTLSQMAAQGRLAEFMGEDLVHYDKYQRTLGIWKTARKIQQSLSDTTRTILEAYRDGVNSFTSANQKKLPVEFSLTGMEPIPWTITHSIALSRMMGWELNVSWWTEVMYGYLQQHLNAQQFDDLTAGLLEYPVGARYGKQSNTSTYGLLKLLETELSKRELFNQTGSGIGSNAWVVDGSKTSHGFPILAGDPHLGLDMPGKWYEVHLNTGNRNISGATLAGAPIVVLGQNDFLAWSLTNIMADDTDFFIEQINPKDRGQYVVDSVNGNAVYEKLDISREIIKTKKGNEVLLEVRKTKHGPIISDIYPNDSLINNRAISLQWTGHEVSHEIEALLSINWASGFSEFKEALPHFKVPAQNFMYADRTGNIAMYSAGNIPIRDYNPILPRKGWDPSYDWKAMVPFNELPKIINPDNGWIANANNKLYSDAYPYHLATFWEPSFRIKRIREILSTSDSLTIEDFIQLQNDVYSYHAKTITETILPTLQKADTLKNFDIAISYLANWNYLYSKNATAASILDLFFMKLTRNTLLDEIGSRAFEQFLHMENVPVRTMHHLLKKEDSSVLFDNIHTQKVTESRHQIIIKSMRETLTFLEDSYGTEPFQWRWEQLHTITLEPPLFAQAAKEPDASNTLKLIVDNMLSAGPYPISGHGLTVNSTQYDWSDPYAVTLGPSIRRIVDFSDLSRSLSIIPTGQSGRPLSTHFGDQTQQWLNGEYKFIYQDSTLFERAYKQTMTLLPAQ